MSGGETSSRLLAAWQRFWFRGIPPHVYAVLRIAFGTICCLSLLGVANLAEFWDLDGFVPGDRGLGLKPWLLLYGLGNSGGRALFFGSFAAYFCMAIGFRSPWAVALSLIASIVEISWNYFPLSGAFGTTQVILFCLIWADCGSVWSLDAWLKNRKGIVSPSMAASIAPLRLLRFQVALIYLNTGLRKMLVEQWRDGSAVHYVVNNNVFRRFPVHVPHGLEGFATLLTYTTLFWEVGFMFMILYGPTRRLALILGVLMHLGMFSVLEIGPFPWVMLASYIAFLDPETIPTLARRVTARYSAGPFASQRFARSASSG